MGGYHLLPADVSSSFFSLRKYNVINFSTVGDMMFFQQQCEYVTSTNLSAKNGIMLWRRVKKGGEWDGTSSVL